MRMSAFSDWLSRRDSFGLICHSWNEDKRLLDTCMAVLEVAWGFLFVSDTDRVNDSTINFLGLVVSVITF